MIEIPVIESPDILHELLSESRSMFYRGQYRQFCRNVIASWASPTRSVAHLNGISVEHTNQINLNRFLGNIVHLIYSGNQWNWSTDSAPILFWYWMTQFCRDPEDTSTVPDGYTITTRGKTVRGMSAFTAAVAGKIYIDNWWIGG